MRLFGLGGGGEDEAVKARREASQQSLEAGGLPLNAIDRLREQASRQGTAEHFFTSDLSVAELALTRQTGYEPLGQVMGSSVYHVGWQWTPSWSGSSGELSVLTQAYYSARHLALGRLQQEAALLGASGVIGVRLERNEYEWGSGLLEFAAIGTAIRERDVSQGVRVQGIGSPQAPTQNIPPFLSDLSGEEFWMLRQAGYRPVGFCVGNCTYYQVPTWNTQSVTSGSWGSWQNQELPDYTQAVYSARSLAMSRMEAEAQAVGAEGVVGADVDIHTETREYEVNNRTRVDIIFHFTATGTAVAPYTGRWPVFSVRSTVSLG